MTIAIDTAALATGPQHLDDYDVILVNSSAGKDSQAMLTHVVEMADAQGVSRDKIIVVHADLGRVEWEGTRELAETQAKAYGLRFEVVARDEDLIDQIKTRRRTLDAEAKTLIDQAEAAEAAGDIDEAIRLLNDAVKKSETPAWPSSQARFCTSDQKTSQVAKLMTALAKEHREANPGAGPIKILNCLGIRSQESAARAKKIAFGPDRPASNGRRTVDRWLPIFDWSEELVWETIRRSGLPWHPAYDAGMPRLSCAFCVLSGRRELILAARLNPALVQDYVALEDEVGHTFRKDMSIRSIAEAAEQAGPLSLADFAA